MFPKGNNGKKLVLNSLILFEQEIWLMLDQIYAVCNDWIYKKLEKSLKS